ncbi:hypothetical protein C818_01617 [Lachnospiraceae bacterium MD308]|nr:hypothetical protein C818_01617 [Lachnospiraceae bacterium MD308]
MDYAIWIDLPINIAIFGYVVMLAVRVFHTGIDIFLQNVLNNMNTTENEMLIICLPVIAFDAIFLMVIEFIYVSLKFRGNEPYITERFSVIGIIGKVISLGFVAASLLVF